MVYSEKLNLDDIVKNKDVQDNTENIRKVKHSNYISADIKTFQSLKHKYSRISREQFEKICIHQCSFLYNNYTDIYNRLIKDELNLELFGQFVSVLEKIENGDENQHSGSVIIGTILKEIYIDSALRRENKTNKHKSYKDKKEKGIRKTKNKVLKEKYPEEYKKATLSWKEYKNNNS